MKRITAPLQNFTLEFEPMDLPSIDLDLINFEVMDLSWPEMDLSWLEVEMDLSWLEVNPNLLEPVDFDMTFDAMGWTLPEIDWLL